MSDDWLSPERYAGRQARLAQLAIEYLRAWYREQLFREPAADSILDLFRRSTKRGRRWRR